MGLLDKLFKKGPKADEVSKGGSLFTAMRIRRMRAGGRRRLMAYTQRR